MTTLTLPTLQPSQATIRVAPLHNGDRLTQAEFHRRYQSAPEKVKAELIEGAVYNRAIAFRPIGPESGFPGSIRTFAA